MNEMVSTMMKRRSVRAYTAQAVDQALLEDVLLAGQYAPSGMGLQGWRFTVVCSEEGKKQANAAIAKGFLAMENAPNLNPFIARMVEKAKTPDPDFLFGAPVYIIVSNDAANGNSMADSALALGNMMLCAHSLGLGSCWINQLPMFADMPHVKELMAGFGMPEGHKVFGAMVLGYAAEPAGEAAPRKEGIVKYV